MQGPNAVLNVMTLPPGATQTQQRIVIDGVRGAMFLYQNGGQLVGSLAMSSGTDPYGNFYPRGFSTNDAGNDTSVWNGAELTFSFIFNTPLVLNSAGLFLYSPTTGAGNLIVSLASIAGTDPYGNAYPKGLNVAVGTVSDTNNLLYAPSPALGNLLFSIAGGPGTDIYGNAFLGGLVAYGSATGIQFACQVGFNGLQFYTAPGPGGPWSSTPDGINFSWNATALAFDASITANRFFIQMGNNPLGIEVNGATADLTVVNTGSGTGRLAEQSPSNIITMLDESLTDNTSINTGNVTVPTAITHAYPTDGTNSVSGNPVFTLKTWFTGVWGNVIMDVYAMIGGTNTLLCTVGGAFGASGDHISGWMEMEVEITGLGSCNAVMTGGIRDLTSQVNILESSTAVLSSVIQSGITFAGGDTIAIGVAFASSVAAQTINTSGSRFTRHG